MIAMLLRLTRRLRGGSARRAAPASRGTALRLRALWVLIALCGLAALVLGLRAALRSGAPAELTSEAIPRIFGSVDLDLLAQSITEMDVERARRLSDEYQRRSLPLAQAQRLAVERARLALYTGDCDSADAILGGLPPDRDQVAGLFDLARRCSGAVAASRVVEDTARGIWLRLQDADDEPLVPFIARVAERARDAVRADLGVELPRPLRIDVVRDLFSLSAVSGLPLEAAETTGTVAVARWGRVTLLSPRASRHGYPWQDTLAHEIVHLALSRATRDFAPLWLQEGVAKRQEQRWREPRPFDDAGTHDMVAKRALEMGNSVGVDNLGPSIAMLPSADAASIAFSEVTSFINFWIAENGRAAFRLLLDDLKGLADRDPDPALRGVTGFGLRDWIVIWQQHLLARDSGAGDELVRPSHGGPDIRAVRLGDLLLKGQHFEAAARVFEGARRATPEVSALRYRASQAELARGRREAAVEQLGSLDELDGPHASWFALDARYKLEAGQAAAAELSSEMALSLDPWSELVACEGHLRGLLGADPWELPEPSSEDRRRLCSMARARPPVQ